MKRKILTFLLILVLFAVAVTEAARITGTGGSTVPLGWPVDSVTKIATWMNSFANAIGFGNGTEYIAIYWDATNGGQINCFVVTENNCNYGRWLNSGKTFSFQDRNRLAMFTVTESTTAPTFLAATGAQIIASNVGLEFTESDTNPTCAAGNYNIYADTSETKLKKCENGTASVLGGGPTIVRKTADETLGNSTTVQADDHLLFAIETSGFYTFSLYVIYQSPAAADIKWNWSLPAGATGQSLAIYMTTGTTDCQTNNTPNIRENALTVEMAAGSEADAVNCVFQVKGQVLSGGTAGNVVLQWAKLVGDAGTTRVMTNSYLIWQKL